MSFMQSLQRKPRRIWFLGHLVLNLIYLLLIIYNNQLYGETNVININQDTNLIAIGILLFFSFFYFNTFLYKLSFKLPAIPINFQASKSEINRIGLLLFIIQFLYVAYFLLSGTRTAGSIEKDSSIISQIWVLIPVDVIFLLFYATYRDSRFFLPNLAINIISNLLRGWSGVILTIIFIESCILIRNKKLTLKKTFFLILFIIVSYPILYFGKLFIRYYGFSSELALDGFSNYLNNIDLLSIFNIAITQVGDRMQLISSAISTYEISNQLSLLISQKVTYPFWAEGIHALAIDRLFSESHKLDIGQGIAAILDPYSADVNWNSNPTFIGWFYIMPFHILTNLIYGSALVFLATILIKPISKNEISKDMLWYMILVLLIPGWYGAYVLFVYSCALYFSLHFIFCKTKINA